jgi:hypothetical protein
MKLIGAAFGIAAMCAVGLGAQQTTSTVDAKTKMKVKDGKEIHVTGCLERNPAGAGYLLTDSTTGGLRYMLITNDDLSKHVGQRVEVKGDATDKGDGKVQIETKAKGTTGDDKTRVESKTEAKGDLAMRYLGVKSLKMISTSCM